MLFALLLVVLSQSQPVILNSLCPNIIAMDSIKRAKDIVIKTRNYHGKSNTEDGTTKNIGG